MSRLTVESQGGYHRSSGEEERRYAGLREGVDSGGGLPGLLIAGLAAAGLGALLWYYVGPDLRRYWKIRDM